MSKPKIVAFYLPQFHAIPENDKAHGKGFTEWTNTKKAKPLYEGHYQPRTPLNENYYDLLKPEVMEEQSSLAMKNGISGFCYYHYWFGKGKKLLEKPVENMLENKNVEIPFCLCWANENWSKRWDGGHNEIIAKQKYGSKKSWRNHINYLMNFFKDERYIKIENKPLFVIYKPELITRFSGMISFFDKQCKKNGFDGIKIFAQFPDIQFMEMRSKKSIDGYILFEPLYTWKETAMGLLDAKTKRKQIIRTRIRCFLSKTVFSQVIPYIQKILNNNNKPKELTIKDYDQDWKKILDRQNLDKNRYKGAFVDWDNTPRNKNGVSYKGATPEKFQKYLSELVKKNQDKENDFIFINAWNEWAEGAFLEPDCKNGYGYLKAIKNVMEE